jgi:hypothetical protein
VIRDSQKSDKRILPNSAWRLVLQRLTHRAVPFARLRNPALGIDLLGNARGFGMFSLDIGLKGHEVLVPNGSQSTIDLLWGLGWERHRGHHGGPRIHGPGPFQAIATRNRGR